MGNLDLNNVLDVKRRPTHAKAVQFTGKNGAEIVAFVREFFDSSPGYEVRNGGTYVNVGSNRLRKGDWVVLESTGGLNVLPDQDFEALYSIKG